MYLKTPEGFSLERTVHSHGWYQLAPFGYDAEKRELSYVFQRAAAHSSLKISVAGYRGGLRLKTHGGVASRDELGRFAELFSRMLSLGQDLRGFHDRVRLDNRLASIALRGEGRMLRSPTVFEDTVKTICTTNCSWALTKSMVSRLVSALGQEDGRGSRAFPTPEAMASADAGFYRDEIRAGYRSEYLLEFAESVAAGELHPESWLDPSVPSDTIRKNLLSVKGVGKYASESMMKLLGRFDSLALDSYLRSEFYKTHNKGRPCSDERIEEHYDRFGDWKGLAIWFDICGEDP